MEDRVQDTVARTAGLQLPILNDTGLGSIVELMRGVADAVLNELYWGQ